ncbi:profilin [Podospora didyma]|uniref:Profilin n=1 Tax=Podospora didyma TaxID=330526 RepID=A0AAE0NZ43_9PEZI|nr:profilin [Podospora didyma]
MSWQAYVDSSGHIDQAAIISVAGDSTWASTPGFAVGADEIKKIIEILTESEGAGAKPAVDKAFSEGVHVAGERYVAYSIEDRHLYARKGRTGIIIAKTKQAILVGHYGENVQVGNATLTVEALADYLIGVGY